MDVRIQVTLQPRSVANIHISCFLKGGADIKSVERILLQFLRNLFTLSCLTSFSSLAVSPYPFPASPCATRFLEDNPFPYSHNPNVIDTCNITDDTPVINDPASISTLPGADTEDLTYDIVCTGNSSPKAAKLIQAARQGLRQFTPTKSNEGCLGVFFLKGDDGETCAVFKPSETDGTVDEAQSRPGIPAGFGYAREYAAHLLDNTDFHHVPATSLVSVNHPTLSGAVSSTGSLQAFVNHECSAEEVGPRLFSTTDVHRIGLLDLRILNCDRHLGNILVTDSDDGQSLVPIDHSLSLPAFPALSGGWFEWLSLPQAKVPFSESTLRFIESLEPVTDVLMLQKELSSNVNSGSCLLSSDSLHTLRICTTFLRKAAARGFTLYDIGCMMSRYSDIDVECVLEQVVNATLSRGSQPTLPTDKDKSFWVAFDEELEGALKRTLAA
eukprot:TRINITY_DN775_c0_g1_i4.p1 TRINITY_DN775_c0_g1~~TRINITY_DN775_c0_g1_i4.p1  ORF type:complete len:441 (+),score=35.11 TRINITY_DN775_c0_g1_i4:359-1681(+)